MTEDFAAWKTLVEKVRPRLLFLVQKAGVPPQDCEDVVHDAILSALDQMEREKFRGQSSIGTWLQVILGGKIADYWRGHARRARITGLDFAGFSDPEAQIIDPRSDKQGANRLEMIILEEAINQLRPRQRIALILFEVQGIPAQEISAKLGWPTGTVYRIVAEARRDLAKYLTICEGSPALKRQIEQDDKTRERA